MKLLVNAPTGKQEIVEIGEGGGYFDLSRVLWDERIDGPIPEITLGGMIKVGTSLIFDKELFDKNDSLPEPKDQHNALIFKQLEKIDAKSIRAIREGDQNRISLWNEEAEALRAKLIKD